MVCSMCLCKNGFVQHEFVRLCIVARDERPIGGEAGSRSSMDGGRAGKAPALRGKATGPTRRANGMGPGWRGHPIGAGTLEWRARATWRCARILCTCKLVYNI